MAASDAIIVGDDWISEHYLTTDATRQSFTARVLDRRKAWDASKAESIGTTRSRFTERRGRIEQTLADLTAGTDPADVSAFNTELLRVLGYLGGGNTWVTDGPVRRLVSDTVDEPSSLVVVEATPVAELDSLLERGTKTGAPVRTLLHEVAGEDGETITAVSRLLTTLMVGEYAPSYALVLAGRWVLLAERERWPEGRYLAVNLQLVAERNQVTRGGEVDRALTVLDAASLVPALDSGDIWWNGVLEESVKHTVGVSQDLRDGVRESIEIIANEVVDRRRAQGLPALAGEHAQPLAVQSLRFLYRILFLLYAEASPELGAVPVGEASYDEGYSLDRLRDLALVEITGASREGTHLYESLGALFRLVDRGHTPPRRAENEDSEFGGVQIEGLEFHALRADLFKGEAIALIEESRLGNAALQRVLALLLLSKEKKNRDRGFISYAELGINQLGAVYEGLMSYTGFFAERDLYEVAKGGDSSKGSWVVEVEKADGITAADFVTEVDPDTGQRKRVLHRRGSFVYRLAGRERQQSASYYTPEVLTRFVVSQALEELLDQGGGVTPAEQIRRLTVCEPALGSGAFAIEAVRQLAEQYLTRRQAELDRRIDPEEYQRELQRVKASIALHQVYGVDLNATAVELAEISLWLDTMVEGLDAPWFGLHLRRGNSLIGARRAVFSRADAERRAHLAETPRDVPVAELAANLAGEKLSGATSGSIHHFLLPHGGWGSAVDAKEAKPLAPRALAELKAWRTHVKAKPTKKQLDTLVELSYRVERLWQLALRRREIAEQQIRRAIPVWGAELPQGGAVSREEIETALHDQGGAYQRLRRVMDAWCALWFWPLTDTDGATPPTVDEWIDGLRGLLGTHVEARTAKDKRDVEARARGGQSSLFSGVTWTDLQLAEEIDLSLANALPVAAVLEQHSWLRVCEDVAARQGFFHWELDFATVFAGGGFDLQVGNPPWVRPRLDLDSLYAEFDVAWLLDPPAAAERQARTDKLLENADAFNDVITDIADTTATSQMLGAPSVYPRLEGLQPDLYRCFMELCWRNASQSGISALITYDSHLTDDKAYALRRETYLRLRRHWQFVNGMMLFTEIKDSKVFGVSVYGGAATNVSFYNATGIYHPEVVTRSRRHDGSGDKPGFRRYDESLRGSWDLRPHRSRIQRVTNDTLSSWASFARESDQRGPKMVNAINEDVASVLSKLSLAPRFGDALPLEGSYGLNERSAVLVRGWSLATSLSNAVVQGPHVGLLNPLAKTPRVSLRSSQDTDVVDLEASGSGAFATTYSRDVAVPDVRPVYGRWRDGSCPIDYYRISWSVMVDNLGARSLVPAIYPPGSLMLETVFSVGGKAAQPEHILLAAGYLSSLVADFAVRSVPKKHVRLSTYERLPFVDDAPLADEIWYRVARLNCIRPEYASLWNSVSQHVAEVAWTGGLAYEARDQLLADAISWNADSALRRDSDRRQAQIEIDALVALSLGITADELCTIYSTQFPVLYGYDRREYLYDANGRLVPMPVQQVWRKKGDAITEGERTHVNASGNRYVYELPFVNLDREADMRTAYAHFERALRERS